MRFYSGISFRLKWKHLKWLAIPLFAILSYFFGSYGYIKTYAYQSSSTNFDVITYDYNSMLDSQICNNTSLLDYFEYIIDNVDWSTSYYQVFTTLPTTYSSLNYSGYKLSMYLIPTSQIQNDYLLYRGTNNANQVGMSYQYGFNISPYYNTYNRRVDFKISVGVNSQTCNLNTTDYQNDLATLNLIDLLQNNHITTSSSNYLINDYVDLSYNSNSSTYASFFEQSQNSITNSSSYNTTLWYYYSSFKYRYIPTDMSSNTFWYYKNVNLVNENKSYSAGDYFDSYYDLHPRIILNSNNYYIGSKNSLGTIYSNFETSNLNNFSIDVSFDSNINYLNAYDYYQNINFTDINCYGRINHNNNYYTYEKFNSCTFELNTDNFNYSNDNDHVNFSINNLEIFDSNNNKITNFSSYDKIFFYLDFQYDDDSLNTYVSNLEFISTSNLLYTDYLKGEIYDNFDLNAYFKMFVSNTGSSNNSSSNFSIRTKNSFLSSNNFIYYQPYNTNTLQPNEVYGFISSNFQNLLVNNSQSLGYMVYHKISVLNLNSFIHIDTILMRDIVISLQDSSSNDFYYSDNTGTITNDDITIDYSYGIEESFTDITGLLPPGPLDSLLNIPFKYLSKTINSLQETCSPLTIPFVFDSELTLPCFDSYYEQFPSSLKIFTEVIPCAFILIVYFKHLYKKISRATTLETTDNDEWGVL